MQPNNPIYYAVYVPNEQQIQDNDGSTNVFFDKIEALKEVKKFKKARFKAFNYYHEALEFARYGSEHPNNNSMLEITSPKTELQTAQTVGEKPSQFRGPKSQDLVWFRKSIESGNLQFVRDTIWENPRYLISSGDTPAILQEGSRYNALHIAAKAKNAEMCEIILSTVGNPSFIQLLYGEENKTNSEEGSKILLDLYLNTPDKGLNETPLHFAVKFGAVEVVEVLVSYPQCNKNVYNKFQQLPKDIICTRVPSDPEQVNKISLLLEDRFYVPVLRSEDNCVQPSIGEPFSPSSPLELNKNPIDPRMEIHAYAGPMKRDEADVFRKKWKTPPRTINNSNILNKFGTPPSRSSIKSDQSTIFRLQDTEKGLERVGRDLAKQFHVGWKEYWPFLDTFADLTTEEGLKMLEDYISKQYMIVNENKNNLTLKNSFEDLSSNNQKFLNNSSIISPISDLCKNFEACTLSENGLNRKEINRKASRVANDCLNRFNETILDALSKSGLSPFLCIEKSCQVFATRISNHIIFLIESRLNNTADSLESEVKHLKSLIGSYMSDTRFNVINFSGIHWRISQIVAQKLKELFDCDEEMKSKKTALEEIIKNYNKIVDVFSSDDEALNSYRLPEKPVRRRSTSNNKQVICLIENILKCLESENDIFDTSDITCEDDCVKIWSKAMPCSCVWKSAPKSGRKSLKKGTKNSKNTNNRLYRRNLENVSRRLSFNDDYNYNDLNSTIESKGDSIITELGNGICEKNQINNKYNGSFCDTSSDSDDDVFLDARSKPATSESEMSETDCDSFDDPQSDPDVFIEGSSPTKMDFAVYNAVKELPLDPSKYPYTYRWRHAVQLYPDDQRMSWPNMNTSSRFTPGGPTSTPNSKSNNLSFTSYSPLNSVLRITGSNTPIKSLKNLRE